MSSRDSFHEKKLYLKQMSQHFKEMAGRQNDETKRVIANTFSKNADILEDLYAQVENLSSQLENAKIQIQQLNNKITQLSSAAVAGQKTDGPS